MLSQPFLSAHVAYRGGSTNQFSTSRGGNSYFKGGRGQSSGNRQVICQLCGKAGHVAIKCFKRFDVHYTGQSLNSPQAFVSASNGENFQVSTDGGWFVDSGTPHHITNDPTNLSMAQPYHGSDHDAVGIGEQLPIQSIGSLLFHLQINPYCLIISCLFLKLPKIL